MNWVWKDWDIMVYVEIFVFCELMWVFGLMDFFGVIFYSSCELCLMCFVVLYDVKVSCFVYSVWLWDVENVGYLGIYILMEEMNWYVVVLIEILGDVFWDEGVIMFFLWD